MTRIPVRGIRFAYFYAWCGFVVYVRQAGPTSARGLRMLADLRRRASEAHLAAMQARRDRRRNRHLLALVRGKAGAA